MSRQISEGRNGFLLIDKPSGWTSHDVTAKIRKLAGQKKTGHAGTLDPMATGLLVLLLGTATRLEPYLAKLDKTYSGQVELGLATDTDDVTGQVLHRAQNGPWPDDSAVAAALKYFESLTSQVPPAFSAIKSGGVTAHRAARAGRPLKLAPRMVAARRLTLLAYDPPFLNFRAEVSAGYYIRSLARDLGAVLEVHSGALAALRREKIGFWSVDEAFTLETLAAWTEDDWQNNLKPPAEALPHLPEIFLTAPEAGRFINGRAGAVDSSDALAPTGTVKVLSPTHKFLGLGEFSLPPSFGGGPPQRPFLRPLRVLSQSAD